MSINLKELYAKRDALQIKALEQRAHWNDPAAYTQDQINRVTQLILENGGARKEIFAPQLLEKQP